MSVVFRSLWPPRLRIAARLSPRTAIQVMPVARRSWKVSAFRVGVAVNGSARVMPAFRKELKLPRDAKKSPLDLDGDVRLGHYRIDKILEGQIVLHTADNVALRAPTDVGTRSAKDVDAALSEIIEVLNERFGTEFTDADQLLFDQFVADH